MSDFRKVERVLIVFGCCLFLFASYLTFLRAEQFMTWLGYSSAGKLQVAGKIVKKKNMVRRRLSNGSGFLPVENDQLVFSRDSVMTGNDSGLVILFKDGSLLELGADTLIEIKFNDEAAGLSNSAFTVNIAKGTVAGTFDHQNMTLLKNGVPQVLPSISKNGLAGEVLASFSTPRINPPEELRSLNLKCTLSELQVSNPFENDENLAGLNATVTCSPTQTSYALQVIDEKGNKVIDQRVKLSLGKAKFLNLPIPGPGEYLIEDHAFSVPKEYEGISWSKPVIRCDNTLAYQLPEMLKNNPKSIKVREETNQNLFSESEWRHQTKIPVRLRVEVEGRHHFWMHSDSILLDRWRECPILRHPLQFSAFSVTAGILLFTWKQIEGAHYQFEISSDRKFQKIIKVEITTRNFERFSASKKGTYFWRVKSIKSGDLSKVFRFTVF